MTWDRYGLSGPESRLVIGAPSDHFHGFSTTVIV
jgi:hypothetical protein